MTLDNFCQFFKIWKTVGSSKEKGPERLAVVQIGFKKKEEEEEQASANTKFQIARFLDCGF